MKTLLIKDSIHGRRTSINALNTYQKDSGEWVAEVDGIEFSRVCTEICHGIDNCTCDNLLVEADLDDDGKKYSLVSS